MSPSPVPEGVEARIARLEDIEEARRLRMRYHHLVNSGRFDEVGTLFADDAVVDLSYLGKYVGREEIARGYRAIGDRSRFLVKQYGHSHTVDIEGNTGTGIAYLDARYARFGVSYMVAGRYEDVYERTADGWCFKSMTFEIFFSVPSALGWAGDELHYLRPDMRPGARDA